MTAMDLYIKMAEDGIDLEDAEQDVANLYIEKETQTEEKEKLYYRGRGINIV